MVQAVISATGRSDKRDILLEKRLVQMRNAPDRLNPREEANNLRVLLSEIGEPGEI
ncbi:hypothetical protein HY946_02715, partial [Candidatus Gottesmanbacteria bacterium]|nr:hypothetical protein [Candidatus Gottesmanbacteria bacterium]